MRRDPCSTPHRRLCPMARAPSARVFLFVPNLHAPRIRAARLQRRPRVGNPKTRRAGNHAAIPNLDSRSIDRRRCVRRNLNAVRRLAHGVQRRRRSRELPGKSPDAHPQTASGSLLSSQRRSVGRIRCDPGSGSRMGQRSRKPQKGRATNESTRANRSSAS